MMYTGEELSNQLPEIVRYLNKLNKMNNEELINELNLYKKIICDLKSNSKSQKFKYNLSIFMYNILNKISNNEFKTIISDLEALKIETIYELSCIDTLNSFINYCKQYKDYKDIDVFYITLMSITQLHNNRCEYSNNLADTYQSRFNGINAYIPAWNDYRDRELKSEINSSINYLTKKIC